MEKIKQLDATIERAIAVHGSEKETLNYELELVVKRKADIDARSVSELQQMVLPKLLFILIGPTCDEFRHRSTSKKVNCNGCRKNMIRILVDKRAKSKR